MTLGELGEIITDETKSGRGLNTTNLSPYGIILRSIYNRRRDRLLRAIGTDPDRFSYPYKGKKFVVTPETNIELATSRAAILIPITE